MLGNWFKTSLWMAAIMALFGVVGAVLGGAQGMPLALAFGLATNLWAYWFSDTIDRYAKGLPMDTAEAHPATAQMMIISPLHGGGIAGLFTTHPPTEERIHRLLALAR